MAEDLAKSINTGKQEWNAFIEGRALSTSLLIKLLRYKYRRQKSIAVNTQITIVGAGGQLKLPALLPSHSLKEYELSVILYPRANNRVIQALLVRRQVSPFTLFVTKELAQQNTTNIKYVTLLEEFPPLTDNGYFVFAFLDAYFSNRATQFSLDTKIQASLIVQDLKKPSLVRETLNRLYSDLNTLLRDAAATSDDIRRAIETKKQQFSGVVKAALDLSSSVLPPLVDATGFLELQVPSEDDDEKLGTADSLFKELQALLQFLLLVSKSGPHTNPAKIELNGVAYGPDKMSKRAYRLSNRILMHVDELNVPPIDALMQTKLGFSQRDYERLIGEEQFITFAIMSHTLDLVKSPLPPKSLLIGPRRDRNRLVLLPPPLILWVTEHETQQQIPLPYYSLAIVARHGQAEAEEEEEEESPTYQEAVYTGTDNLAEAITVRQMTRDMLLKQAGIKCSRRQVIFPNINAMSAPHFTTWYVAFLVQKLSAGIQVVKSPTEFDWVTRADTFLSETTQAKLFANTRRIIIKTQRSILALLYPKK